MSRFKAVFLDIGATVLEVRGVAEPYRKILTVHGYPATSDQVRAWLARLRSSDSAAAGGQFDPREAAERRAARLDALLDVAGVTAERDACRAAMIESWTGRDVFALYPDSAAALAALRHAGLIVAAVSNWEPRLAELCANHGIAGYFDFILASEAEGCAKPDRCLFDIALQRAGIEPGEALHAGDQMIEDVRGAEAVGIHAVLVDRGGTQAGSHSPRVRSLSGLVALALAGDWLQGRVVAGEGKAAGFMELPWVIDQIRDRLGFVPYPGTLNLTLDSPTAIAVREDLVRSAGIPIEPASGFCAARCFPVRIEGDLPGAVLLPDVPGYPADAIEVVAPECLREALPVKDGASVTLAVSPGPICS